MILGPSSPLLPKPTWPNPGNLLPRSRARILSPGNLQELTDFRDLLGPGLGATPRSLRSNLSICLPGMLEPRSTPLRSPRTCTDYALHGSQSLELPFSSRNLLKRADRILQAIACAER